METKQKNIKRILFGGILFVLCVPVLQQVFQFKKVGELSGVITSTQYQEFNAEKWFNGSYQENTTKYLNENFGFRNYFVRLNNQRYYSLYNMAKANGVVIGKEGYLYEKNYIKAHFGTDFIGKAEIESRTKKLKFLQDTLAKKGVDLIVVLAPGKGSFFPEFIPDEMQVKHAPNRRNFIAYRNAFREMGVNHLDFKTWFLNMKDTSSYPLFPKAGIHWSKYGEVLAADSIARKIGAMRNVKMPQLVVDEIFWSEENLMEDYDIGEGMNLLFDLPTYPMAYPKYHIATDSATQPQKTLFVADSYYWGMFNNGFSRDLFGDGRFWYYNQGIYPDSYESPLNVKDINMVEKVEENDVIILLSTDANLYKFAFGFIEELYDAYH